MYVYTYVCIQSSGNLQVGFMYFNVLSDMRYSIAVASGNQHTSHIHLYTHIAVPH